MEGVDGRDEREGEDPRVGEDPRDERDGDETREGAAVDDVVVEGGCAIVDEGGCVNGVDVSVGVVPDEAAPGRGDSRSVLDWGGCDVGGALLLGGSDDGLSWSPSKSASRAGFLNQSGGTGKFDPAGVAGSEGACAG